MGHQMRAGALIRDCEKAPRTIQQLKEAERLSLRYQVLCQSTAFVAIDKSVGILPVLQAVREVPDKKCASESNIEKLPLWRVNQEERQRECKEVFQCHSPGLDDKMLTLEQMLRQMCADGSFEPASELSSALGISQAAIMAWRREQWAGSSVNDHVLTTALVLACLRMQFSAEYMTWHLAANKSLAWLQKCECEWQSATIADVEALIAVCVERLSTISREEDV